MEVIAVGSRTQEQADDFGKRYDIPKRYATYEALVSDPDVDIIYVASLSTLHRDHTLLALNAGKNVLCEKPLAMNAKQAEEMIQLAKQKNCFLIEAIWTSFYPALEEVRNLISSGDLGDIKMVIADIGFKNPGVPSLSKPELGGGATLAIGLYAIWIAQVAFQGKYPSSITSFGSIGQYGSDEQVGVTLGYDKDQVAQLSYSLLANTPNQAIIIGSKGSVRMETSFWSPTKLTIDLEGHKPKHSEFPLPLPRHDQTFNFHNSIGLRYEATHVNNMEQDDRENPLVPIQQSLDILRIMDTIRSQIGMSYDCDK
eukprot:TRINITY_DN172_c0_g1_i2.p1 TRINITY_DN172_c0_g1~~TRINITY_DN172_c0_g1_i2.p1  ORF type:complete len:312 (+),score=99.53 TRINITY_DN172_c0_g1_i2:304-1239(+)